MTGTLIVLAILYFVPTLIAWGRHHNTGGVAIVNLLLGWSVIGWVAALIMACGANRAQQVTVIQQQAPARFDPQTGEPVAPAEPQLPPASPS